jgi:ankyrin repeat protein
MSRILTFFQSAKVEPIHFAAAKGFVPVISLLLEHGADIEARNAVS